VPTEVKICGLTDEAAVAAVVEARADHAGFVFFPPSPRHVAPERAAALAKPLRGQVTTVALTVDADDQTFDDIFDKLGPELLQLHGSESPERVANLKARYRVPVMKMVPIRARADLAGIESYLGVADRILFDAKVPASASRPGGMGIRFDWHILVGVDLALPVMLSGGLDAKSVGEAIAIAAPDAVDVSSGVESAPGKKDPKAIAAFVAAVRAADASAARSQSNLERSVS